MKTYIYSILLSLLMIVTSCSKEDNCDNPVDCLPPETQSGVGTFGCLVNGEIFKPGGSQFSGPTQQANYNIDLEGELFFSLIAINNNSNKAIGINISGIEIIEGDAYDLRYDEQNSKLVIYDSGSSTYETGRDYSGEIEFTKFDDINGIISGKFWFDAINEKGEIVEIREGRFDMKYN
ncbi:DUF6252 family protein [Gillisia sp. JM1]|uniref:DUF6252 family protein n=1 Tax=Gillisia sp. JM1 TaxID=1283286 RepID=UPI0004299D2F|nr:DUF6252 family protein [Gillisia sp. JM1]